MGDGVLREEDITGSQDFDVSGDTDSLDRQVACKSVPDVALYHHARTCAPLRFAEQGRSSLWFTAARVDRQEVEELSADARRGGRDPRRSFFLMHRMASYRWLSRLSCMGRQLEPDCCAAFCPACQSSLFPPAAANHVHMNAGRGCGTSGRMPPAPSVWQPGRRPPARHRLC